MNERIRPGSGEDRGRNQPTDDDEPVDADGPPDRFINFYRCPREDGGYGHKWKDPSPYTSNDHCPVCDLGDIEPYRSEDI